MGLTREISKTCIAAAVVVMTANRHDDGWCATRSKVLARHQARSQMLKGSSQQQQSRLAQLQAWGRAFALNGTFRIPLLTTTSAIHPMRHFDQQPWKGLRAGGPTAHQLVTTHYTIIHHCLARSEKTRNTSQLVCDLTMLAQLALSRRFSVCSSSVVHIGSWRWRGHGTWFTQLLSCSAVSACEHLISCGRRVAMAIRHRERRLRSR